ncbi:hypothetical protein DFH09DRAFT_1080689 [Mycena vulgaris]|nr:hypothetical protein DFH09DRAFT_1080689 [Mycena vulgaris]
MSRESQCHLLAFQTGLKIFFSVLSRRSLRRVAPSVPSGQPLSHHCVVAAIKDGRRRRLAPSPTLAINPIKGAAPRTELARSGLKNDDKLVRKLRFASYVTPTMHKNIQRDIKPTAYGCPCRAWKICDVEAALFKKLVVEFLLGVLILQWGEKTGFINTTITHNHRCATY